MIKTIAPSEAIRTSDELKFYLSCASVYETLIRSLLFPASLRDMLIGLRSSITGKVNDSPFHYATGPDYLVDCFYSDAWLTAT